MSDLKDPKNKKLIDDFVAEHSPLIHKHVNILKSKGLVPSSVEESDLHMAGIHGLIDALHKYSPDIAGRTKSKEGENAFAKYAEKRISGKMLDHIASQDPIPKSARIKAKNLALLQQQPKAVEPQTNVEATPVETLAAPSIKNPIK